MSLKAAGCSKTAYLASVTVLGNVVSYLLYAVGMPYSEVINHTGQQHIFRPAPHSLSALRVVLRCQVRVLFKCRACTILFFCFLRRLFLFFLLSRLLESFVFCILPTPIVMISFP